MPNPDIGTIKCPMRGHTATVRRCSKGQRLLYWFCACGMIRPNLPEGQEWILEHAKLHGPAELAAAKDDQVTPLREEPAPAPAPVTEKPAAPTPAPAPIPVTAKPATKPRPAPVTKKPPAAPAPVKPAPRRSLLPDL